METINYRQRVIDVFCVILIFPALFFILLSLMKYVFGIEGPFDSVYPTLEWLGIKEDIGLNINLLILFGPVIAFFIAAWQVFILKWKNTKEQLHVQVTMLKKKWPIFIMFLSALVTLTLGIYLVLENFGIRE